MRCGEMWRRRLSWWREVVEAWAGGELEVEA